MPRAASALALALIALGATPAAGAPERVGRDTGLTPLGRLLSPAGRQVALGPFPTGGAISPDGRFYWAVDSGRGLTWVHIVEVATARELQRLPIPGGFVGVALSRDGRRAFVSGEPPDAKPDPASKGVNGAVVHTYTVDPHTGRATEGEPIALGGTRDGQAAADELPPASKVNPWPQGLAISGDGRLLVVALTQADQAAIVDLASRHVTLAPVGRYPYAVAMDPRRPRAYVSNEYDGTVSVIDLPGGAPVATIGVGGTSGDRYAHAEGITVDPVADRAYVAVTNRDTVAVLDTRHLTLERLIGVGRPQAGGSAPVAVAVTPDGTTLYAALSDEDALVGISLTARPRVAPRARRFLRVRSPVAIKRYRRLTTRPRRPVTRARRRLLAARLLRGQPVPACAGPTAAQDRRFGLAVLRAYAVHDRAVARRRHRHHRRHRAADRRLARSLRRARRALPRLVLCPPAGQIPGLPAFQVIGRLPTAWYPSDVSISADGRRLVWLTARGYGTGPNDDGVGIKEKLIGRAGILATPSDRGLRAMTPAADRQIAPTNARPAPPGSPVVGPDGGPSQQIKHVFYVVKENRTYDQIFGSDPRGAGAPGLELFDDNGVRGPAGGVTPNAHALTRSFSLLDNVMANSENSTDGHKVTSGANPTDYTIKYVEASRSKRGNPDIFAIGVPPNGFIFDQLARQSVSFHNFGELGAGNQPFSNDGRPTYDASFQGTDPRYPSQIFGSCEPAVPTPPGTPNSVRCTTDSGRVGATAGPPAAQSRMDSFTPVFSQQVASATVPTFTYMILFNDHTNGTDPGVYTPKAQVADNDLALGQLVETISQSPVWADSAIFVVEDDSQGGSDHIDAHRIPAYVISPWARRGAVVSTRYDQYSFLHTAELMAGLRPLSLFDALATPLYDAFISGTEHPNVEGTRYRAIQPEQSLTEVNSAQAADAQLSRRLPWNLVDAVPQSLSDRILWHSVYGAGHTPPPVGPNASASELGRARMALRAYRAGRNVRRALTATAEP
ncbi:MAG TPA: alkaline phosphatase family protein [Solirubrobacteraceae bacterium]|nr:alkaline phosphatase family protein [Solirubrobacteraceae bacterium]